MLVTGEVGIGKTGLGVSTRRQAATKARARELG